MPFETIGQQGGSRYMIVDTEHITEDEDGRSVDMRAPAFIVDLRKEVVGPPTPVGSIVAHGGGTWVDVPPEGEEFPSASELLSSVGTTAEELPENDHRPKYRESDVE